MFDFSDLSGPFSICISDPPWRFASNSRAKPGRNPMRHYDCMTVEEIAAMPVRDLFEKDALLLMWTTAPFAARTFEVISAWGFEYVSQFTWPKDKAGTGFWIRNQHEIVYLCKRGKFPCPKPAPFASSIISGAQREHSRKPDSLHTQIDAQPAWQGLRKLEMFAREPRAGWTVWGNETDKFARPGPVAIPADLEDLI